MLRIPLLSNLTCIFLVNIVIVTKWPLLKFKHERRISGFCNVK
nr:MAG TPA: hypothetical protein [Caudoviricetes sp.]